MDEQDEYEPEHRSDNPFWFDKSGCQEAIHTLYNFLDGELTDDRRQAISHHLHECSPCLDAFDFEAELKMVIAKKCRDQVPEALRNRVYRALIEASNLPPGTEYSTGMSPI